MELRVCEVLDPICNFSVCFSPPWKECRRRDSGDFVLGYSVILSLCNLEDIFSTRANFWRKQGKRDNFAKRPSSLGGWTRKISCSWMVVFVATALREIFSFFFFAILRARTSPFCRINKSAVYLGRKDVHYFLAIKHGSALGEGQAKRQRERERERERPVIVHAGTTSVSWSSK